MYRLFILCCMAVLAVGCNQDGAGNTGTRAGGNQISKQKYWLDKEPVDAKSVITARKEAADGQDIVVVGRIGGSKKPFGILPYQAGPADYELLPLDANGRFWIDIMVRKIEALHKWIAPGQAFLRPELF